IGVVGPNFTNYSNKAQQIATIKRHGSSVEKLEFRNLHIHPAGGGETSVIATFAGSPLFNIDGIDSNAECRYYLRLEKQPEQWEVSAIFINHWISNQQSFDFVFDPERSPVKNAK